MLLACYNIIRETQKSIECLTCGKWFHALTTCIDSFDSKIRNTIEVCQKCLANALPFQTLGNLKFNPFDASSNIALSENNANIDNRSKINCEYYLPNDFKQQINQENLSNSFSIIHLNIRSIVNKFESFKQLINSLTTPFQLIGLTETWLNDTNKDLFKLKNYDFVNMNRSTKIGGGVGIYIANQINYKIRSDLNLSDENIIESIFIELVTAVGKNIIVGVIYRPPNSKFDSFENKMNQILGKIDQENKICYLMGDFNIDLLKSESCDYTNRFFEQLFTSSYMPLILRPTRITEHTATLWNNFLRYI